MCDINNINVFIQSFITHCNSLTLTFIGESLADVDEDVLHLQYTSKVCTGCVLVSGWTCLLGIY